SPSPDRGCESLECVRARPKRNQTVGAHTATSSGSGSLWWTARPASAPCARRVSHPCQHPSHRHTAGQISDRLQATDLGLLPTDTHTLTRTHSLRLCLRLLPTPIHSGCIVVLLNESARRFPETQCSSFQTKTLERERST